MKLNFGKYNGQEVDEIVQTKRGREYLEWLVDQPVQPGKWQEANEARNEYIRKVLSGSENEPENPQPIPENPKDDSNVLLAILEVLNRIEANQRKLMTKEGIIWDND